MRTMIVILFAVTACAPALQQETATAIPGCQYDAQCKDDRVCSNHRCTNPIQAQVQVQPPAQAQNAARASNYTMQGMPLERGTLAERCDGGDVESCYDYAMAKAIGMGVPKDEGDARAYFQKACRGGHVFGCVNLLFLLKKKGDAREKCPSAIALEYSDYAAECDAGDAEACYQVARFQDRSLVKGIRKDLARARFSYSKACEGGHGMSCTALSRMWLEGIGGPKDKSKAEELAKRACELGMEEGCAPKNLAAQ